ncbi:MAG: hypothetical protein K8F30_12410 [Taibaiella sp.]|nr:hypothetical protein [Taibaiella sp.]
MKQRPRRVILRKLLLRRRGNKRLWPALLSLCLGTVILLYAIILYTGFRDALSGKYDTGSIEGTYLTISKQIDAEQEITKQKPALFSNTEIRALGSLPVVQDIGMFTSARFPVEVGFKGDSMQFSTRLFIESVPDRFIDNKPLDWYWQYTAKEVPVIVSTEFLNLYNYGYAPNQGVPQLTRGTIQSLHFTLNIGIGNNAAEYTARVAGFSDRISSILAPEAFIQYGNKHFAPVQEEPQPSRLILKVKDPSDDLLVEYLHEAKYETNNELLRANRMRTVVYAATLGMGLLAVVLLLMGGTVFTLFTELTIARAQHNLQLLVQLGYSPRFLSRFIFRRYVFIILAVMAAAGIAAIYAQVRTARVALEMDIHIARFPGWEVWVALGAVTVVLLIFVKRKVDKGVK